VAAAEVAVGLALVVRIFRDEPVPDVDDYHSLSG
jgi:NADH:ubiquinone oxidoreductase subunit K